MSTTVDPTARLTSNTPLDVNDARLMDQGISDRVALLCHVRKTPIVLYGMMVELTQQYYADPLNAPIDVCAVWDKDPSKSKIWIDTEYKWEDSAPEFRPAIYIKLGDIRYKSLTGRDDAFMAMDLKEGEYHFSRSGEGIASWVHIGSTKGETVTLAGSTMDFLDAFGRIIRDDLNFQSFNLVSLSPLQADKESKDRYRSVVNVAFSFEDTWSIKFESQKLKRIVLRARQELALSGIL